MDTVLNYSPLDPQFTTHLLNLAMATLLSGIIGLERGFHGRAAGIRTNVLVGIGACLFTILSALIASSGQVVTGSGIGIPDPGRIAAQIVTGIGFLGAGAIVKSGINIRGLTTASSMWIVAGIGMACGAGYIAIAATATLLSLLVLTLVSFSENFLPSHSYRSIKIQLGSQKTAQDVISAIKTVARVQSVSFDYNTLKNDYFIVVNIRLLKCTKTDSAFEKVYKRIQESTSELISIRWKLQN